MVRSRGAVLIYLFPTLNKQSHNLEGRRFSLTSQAALAVGRHSVLRPGAHRRRKAPGLLALLITGGELRSHTKGGAQLAFRRNCLNALFVLERALLMVVGQTPARLNAEKRPAVRP
jgi:hypothetical protein